MTRGFCVLSGHLNIIKDIGMIFFNLVKSHLSIIELKILLVFYWSLLECIVNLSQAYKHKYD